MSWALSFAVRPSTYLVCTGYSVCCNKPPVTQQSHANKVAHMLTWCPSQFIVIQVSNTHPSTACRLTTIKKPITMYITIWVVRIFYSHSLFSSQSNSLRTLQTINTATQHKLSIASPDIAARTPHFSEPNLLQKCGCGSKTACFVPWWNGEPLVVANRCGKWYNDITCAYLRLLEV